jgi:hypothetical protein
MSKQWETARHCHSALSFLLLNIQRQNGNRESYLPFDFDSETSAHRGRWKRAKLDQEHSEEAENAISSRSAASLPSGGSGSNDTTPPGVGAEQSPANNPTHSSAVNSPPREFLMPPTDPRVGFPVYEPVGGSGDQPSRYSYSPLLMMNLSGLDDPQWPGGSASATNFDLNMTDLFQGSTWDMFDVSQPANPANF